MITCIPQYEKEDDKYSVVSKYSKVANLFGKLCMGVAALFQDGETIRFQDGSVMLFN
jgi:hypothetical protein